MTVCWLLNRPLPSRIFPTSAPSSPHSYDQVTLISTVQKPSDPALMQSKQSGYRRCAGQCATPIILTIASRCETARRDTAEASTTAATTKPTTNNNNNSRQTRVPYGPPRHADSKDRTESPGGQIQYRRTRVHAFTYIPFSTREGEIGGGAHP